MTRAELIAKAIDARVGEPARLLAKRAQGVAERNGNTAALIAAIGEAIADLNVRVHAPSAGPRGTYYLN